MPDTKPANSSELGRWIVLPPLVAADRDQLRARGPWQLSLSLVPKGQTALRAQVQVHMIRPTVELGCLFVGFDPC